MNSKTVCDNSKPRTPSLDLSLENVDQGLMSCTLLQQSLERYDGIDDKWK
jgi:hypothetical protein